MKVNLYPGTAPYTRESSSQAQPSLDFCEAEGTRGLVVVCPGGGYEFKAEHEGLPIAAALSAMGISAAVLDYRVRPCHREAPLSDALRAIRTARARGYEKVGILGFSAGANLCCCAATLWDRGNPGAEDPVERLSSRPDCFISCYGVVSMGEFTHEGSRTALLGAQADDEGLRRRFSAEENVTDETPPAFLWHTSDDGLVPVQNSLQLGMALAAHHIPFELHVTPHGRHGLGLSADEPVSANWLREAARWLLQQGFGI